MATDRLIGDEGQFDDIDQNQLLAGVFEIYGDSIPVDGLDLAHPPFGAPGVAYAITWYQ